MDHFFCSEACRQADEDIVGSATHYSTYVLIECPMPWAYDAFDSPKIPARLKSLIQAVKLAKLSVRFLLITQNQRRNLDRLKLIVYEQVQEKFSDGYRGFETEVEDLEQAAKVAEQHFFKAIRVEDYPLQTLQPSTSRDILVCTHGSHDKCCAKYGNPFYNQATDMANELKMSEVRVWKSSHFGGHRFAPTAIHFPDGRYYGLLDATSFQSILTQTGEMQHLQRVYRGWSILPIEVQVLERKLMRHHGWHWFDYRVALQSIHYNPDKTEIQTELAFKGKTGVIYLCEARLMKDESKTLKLIGSCNGNRPSEFVKYTVEAYNLRLICSEPEPFTTYAQKAS
ncbi:MAG: sucrase ferredoxin [Microcoleaceae cyanobacterium]